ncbi:hypothetical protein [Streptomyces sp. ISL-44]|uniref:hypothetical protein n=1 Tax=Streptomyces sp. ISL-44 TaxID=2819184 RepID=UPI0035ABDFD8
MKQTVKGLGGLVGLQGWDTFKQSWTGLAKLGTGLAIATMPGVGPLFMAAPDDKLPSWLRDSRTAMKETGKALLAWDQWGSNPGRAAGAVTFNVLTTVFTGGAGGAASGAGKAGAVAKALSFAGKAGRAIDPMTYMFKGAGAGISKIGDVMASLKGMGKFEAPNINNISDPVHAMDNGTPGARPDTTPGGHAADNTPRGGSRPDTPSTAGTHPDGPGTGATHTDGPGSGGHGDGPSGTSGHGTGTGGHLPDAPGTGGVDDATRGADDASTSADGTPPPRQPVPRPSFMRDGVNPYGRRGSLSLEQIEEIQIYRANEEPGYFEHHYRKDGTRKSLEVYDSSGYTPPQLTRLSDDAPWIPAKGAPAPPKPHYLDAGYIKVGADTVSDTSRLKVLEEAAQARHFAIKWDNIVADWKMETALAHEAHGTPESAGLWGEARGTYKESHTHMGEAAEAFGEKAAEHHYIAERFGDFDRQTLLGPKNGNDQFDQVWKHEDGRVVVIEAKSSVGTELGRRTLPGGKQVSQGSREYFLDIIRVMKKRGEVDTVAALEAAMKHNKLEYVVIKGEKNAGTYTGYQYRRFDVSKGTLP